MDESEIEAALRREIIQLNLELKHLKQSHVLVIDTYTNIIRIMIDELKGSR